MAVGVSLRSEQVAEHTSQVSDIRLGFEFEGAAVSEVFGELTGATLAERRDRDGLFLLHDELVLFGCRFGLESLPRKTSFEEIDKNVADRF